MDDFDDDDRGPQSVENMLKECRQVTNSCRLQRSFDHMKLKKFFKQDGSVDVQAEVAKEYVEKRRKLEAVEAKLERQAVVRADLATDEPRAHSGDTGMDAKRAAIRRRQARARETRGDANEDDIKGVELLAAHETACRDYENALKRALGRMSSLAVAYTRQEEVRDDLEAFDILLHNMHVLTEPAPGAAASGLTNDKVLEVMEDETLRKFFESEACKVVIASQRVALELDGKEELLDRLREDPLLTALYCVIQFELESQARRQRELDAEVAREELLREEEVRALADAKADGRARRRRDRQPSSEGARVLVDATPGHNGELAAAAAPAANACEELSEPQSRDRTPRPSKESVVTVQGACGTAASEASGAVATDAEDPWEVSAKRVKPKPSKQREGKSRRAQGSKDIGRGGGPSSHLVSPDGQLVTTMGYVCKPFLRGECMNLQCDKAHPPGCVEYRVACEYHMAGRCTRGKQCRYAHVTAAVLAKHRAQMESAGADGANGLGGGSGGSKGRERRDVSTESVDPQFAGAAAAEDAAKTVVRQSPECMAVPAVVSEAIEGGRALLKSTQDACGLAVLSAVHLLLSIPSLRGMLRDSTTHLHNEGSACIFCAFARLSDLWDAHETLLLDPIEDVHEALRDAFPERLGELSGRDVAVIMLDLLRIVMDPACADDREQSMIGRTFGVCCQDGNAEEVFWEMALDATLKPGIGPLPRTLLSDVTVVRLDGWSKAQHSDWLTSVLKGSLTERDLLASFGYEPVPWGPTCAPRPQVHAVVVESESGDGCGIVFPCTDEASTAVMWTDQLTRLRSDSAVQLAQSVVGASSAWRATAIVLAR